MTENSMENITEDILQERFLLARERIAEIAKLENVSFMTVKDCLTCIQKKFQTFFDNFFQILRIILTL